jgi:hypothetical protein
MEGFKVPRNRSLRSPSVVDLLAPVVSHTALAIYVAGRNVVGAAVGTAVALTSNFILFQLPVQAIRRRPGTRIFS